jgi:hypothetical protein
MATEEPLYEDGTPDLEGFEAELVDAVSREEPWSLVERFADLERISGSEDEGRQRRTSVIASTIWGSTTSATNRSCTAWYRSTPRSSPTRPRVRST